MEGNNGGMILNVNTIPIRKKKKPNKNNNAQVRIAPREVINSFKSVREQGNILNKISSDSHVKTTKPTPVSSGILKKNIVPSQSIWKKFKESNRNYRGIKPLVNSSTKSNGVKKKTVVINDSRNVRIFPEKTSSVGKVNQNEVFEPHEGDESYSKNQSKLDKNLGDFQKNSDFHFGSRRKSPTKFSDCDQFRFHKNFAPDQGKSEFNTGKTTSLFDNNPEIPEIPHRAVKPIKEEVFSNLSFEDMKLHSYMVKYLKESMGLTKMTIVQEKSIPVLLQNKDALIRSQTGSGKTLAFALPILHKLQEIRPKLNRSDGVSVLIIVPTRELALQTYEVFNKLVKSYTWIVAGYLVGGEKRKSEKARLRKGITILIGTPGRLIDHIRHTKALQLDKVSCLVIDEADRLLDMGYEKDVSFMLEALSQSDSNLLHPNYMFPEDKQRDDEQKHRQTILLSATLTPKVQKLAGLSLRDPIFVDACDQNLISSDRVPVSFSDVGTETNTMVLPDSLIQKYIVIPPKLKLITLVAFILCKSKLSPGKKMLVFVATQDMVDFYSELLSSVLGTSKRADSSSDDLTQFSNSQIELFKLHGNMNQCKRTEVFKAFRSSTSGVLLCTDVAARGLDLPEVDWVVQFTGPISVSDYVHRVGRTARGGQSGSSIIFLTPNEVRFIEKLENCQIRLREENMEIYLNHLWSMNSSHRSSAEDAATYLQAHFEKMVTDDRRLYDSACKAYSSWSRFYASYPRNMKDTFSVKTVHQGHYAKSFALKDSPSVIISYSRKNNLNEKKFPSKRPRERSRSDAENKFMGNARSADISEFDSGLEPLPKKKKSA